MEPIVSSETSAIRTQTPGNYPKRNRLHLQHGKSLKTRIIHNGMTSFKWHLLRTSGGSIITLCTWKVDTSPCSLCDTCILLHILELWTHCSENWRVYQYGSLEPWIKCFIKYYRGADKSLARPGRKQATFPAFYGTLRFHYHIHNSPPPVPTLAKSIHSSAHHTFDRHSLFPS